MSERDYSPPRRETDDRQRGGVAPPPGGVTDPNGIRKDATQDEDLVGTERRMPPNADRGGPPRRL